MSLAPVDLVFMAFGLVIAIWAVVDPRGILKFLHLARPTDFTQRRLAFFRVAAIMTILGILLKLAEVLVIRK